MLYHFSGIIYLIQFALHLLTCHLEETSCISYLNCLSYQTYSLAFDYACTVAILSGQVGFEPQFIVE